MGNTVMEDTIVNAILAASKEAGLTKEQTEIFGFAFSKEMAKEE